MKISRTVQHPWFHDLVRAKRKRFWNNVQEAYHLEFQVLHIPNEKNNVYYGV